MRRHHLQVFRWAVIAAGDLDAADDIAQEVWIRVHRSLASFHGTAKFTTWLYRIVANAAIDGRRTTDRRSAELRKIGRDADPARSVVAHRDEIDQQRLFAVVSSCLGHLPIRQRAVFAMADLEGVATAEIAERLSMAEATVRAHLFKARRGIRAKLLQDLPQLVKEYRE